MTDSRASPKTNLSKNVLQMKFMQRSVLKIERDQNEEEKQKIIDEEHWVLDLPEYKTKEQVFVTDQSYFFCEQLRFARLSFKGFNPEIEKLMAADAAEKEEKISEEKEKQNSVSDQQMANRYSSLMGVLAKKFAKKRSRGNEVEDQEGDEPVRKKAFVKPSTD